MNALGSLSFIVVTHNSLRTISDCLSSIQNQSIGPTEIVVVDNNSIDGTPDAVKDEFPELKVIRNESNLGYGGGNNIGLEHCHGDLVAFVNPDVALHREWAALLLNHMRLEQECGAAEGKLLLAQDPHRINCRGSHVNVLGFGCATGYGLLDDGDDAVRDVTYCSGAAFVVRRDAFMRAGQFDASYFLYHEDVDLGLRLQSCGWKLHCVASALAYHHHKGTLTPEKTYFLERNRWVTLMKNMTFQYFVRAGPLLMVSELGLLLYMMAKGLGRSKAKAMIDALRRSQTLTMTGVRRQPSQPDRRGSVILTDDFPPLVRGRETLTAIARRIQTAYCNSFFAEPVTLR